MKGYMAYKSARVEIGISKRKHHKLTCTPMGNTFARSMVPNPNTSVSMIADQTS